MTLGVLRERPTALQPATGAAGLVRAPQPVQASASAAARRKPLHEIEAEWKGPRTVGCACGGSISARAIDTEIAHAVAVHNASTGHQRWRERR